MNETLKDLLKNPHHLDFFREFGYIKYTGCRSDKYKLYPNVTLMLPIGMSEAELADKIEQWGRES